MNATPQDLDEVTPVPLPPGPGERLREAREAAALSIHEVSTAMRLNSRVIQAIEADDYGDLAAPAFVRGYLRGYARLVGLEPEPLIEAFEQRNVTPPALVPDISEGPQIRSTDFPVRLVTYIMAAALIVLVVIWWRNQHFTLDGFDMELPGELVEPETVGGEPVGETTDRETGPEMAGGTEKTDPDASLPATLARAPEEASESASESAQPPMPVSIPEPVPESAALPETLVADAADLRVREAPAMPETPPEPAHTPSAPAPEESEAPVQPPSSWGEHSSADIDVVVVPETVQDAPLTSGNRIEMRFGAECWVEIYDSTDNRLFYGLVQPGQTLTRAGPGPVRLVVGNSDGVELIRYNGTLIDFGRFVTGGVARFSIGGRPPAAFPSPERENAGE